LATGTGRSIVDAWGRTIVGGDDGCCCCCRQGSVAFDPANSWLYVGSIRSLVCMYSDASCSTLVTRWATQLRARNQFEQGGRMDHTNYPIREWCGEFYDSLVCQYVTGAAYGYDIEGCGSAYIPPADGPPWSSCTHVDYWLRYNVSLGKWQSSSDGASWTTLEYPTQSPTGFSGTYQSASCVDVGGGDYVNIWITADDVEVRDNDACDA
jgi:hypothetical protein